MDGEFLKLLNRRNLQIAIGLGAISTILANALVWPHLLTATLLAIGGAVLAAAILAYLALPTEEIAQYLWDRGLSDVFLNRRNDLPTEFWLGLINKSRHHFKTLGPAHHGYLSDHDTREAFNAAFRNAINRGVEIELLWLKPESDEAKIRESEEGRDTRWDAVDAMEFFSGFKAQVAAKPTGRLTMWEYVATPSCGIVWADNQVVVTHYLSPKPNLFAPGLILRQTEPQPKGPRKLLNQVLPRTKQLPDIYTGMYNEIREKATEITAERLAALVELKPSYQIKKISEANLRKAPQEETST